MTERGIIAVVLTDAAPIGNVGMELLAAAEALANETNVVLQGAASKVPYFERQLKRIES